MGLRFCQLPLPIVFFPAEDDIRGGHVTGVQTCALPISASMGQFLLSSGTPGKRYATPHARILMHQPSGGIGGTESDIRIQAQLIMHMKQVMSELTAEQTGQNIETILEDNARDKWFTAEEGLEYGFFDHIASGTASMVGGGGIDRK